MKFSQTHRRPLIIGPLPYWKHLRIYDKGALNGLVSIVYCLCLMVVHSGNRGIFHDFFSALVPSPTIYLQTDLSNNNFHLTTCEVWGSDKVREGRGKGPVAVKGTMGPCSGVQVYNDSIWGVITVFTRGAVQCPQVLVWIMTVCSGAASLITQTTSTMKMSTMLCSRNTLFWNTPSSA